MTRKFAIVVIILCCVLALPSTVEASATVTSAVRTCSSFAVTGTATAPYIAMYAYNSVTFAQLGFHSMAVTGGNFSYTLNLTPQAAGTNILYTVLGTTQLAVTIDDVETYYDGEAGYSTATNCTLAPTATPPPATSAPTATAVAFNPDLTGGMMGTATTLFNGLGTILLAILGIPFAFWLVGKVLNAVKI